MGQTQGPLCLIPVVWYLVPVAWWVCEALWWVATTWTCTRVLQEQGVMLRGAQHSMGVRVPHSPPPTPCPCPQS